jgi:DNA-binding NtrC family response regulator
MADQMFVLVAEDEEWISLPIVQALLDQGFEVMEAEDAAAALIVLESHARRIHVLFTDIQIPGTIDGLALAHHNLDALAVDLVARYVGPASP